MSESPAYQYGRILGSVKDAYVKMFEDIARGMRESRGRRQQTHDPDARAEWRYAQRIETERRIGRRYVNRIADQARRDLGLPTEKRRP